METERRQPIKEWSDATTTSLIAHAPDGKRYKRIAKRQPMPTRWPVKEWLDAATTPLYHWCATADPEPITPQTPEHVCDIWEVATDQDEAAEKAEPAAKAPTIAELIGRVMYTQEETVSEPVPLLRRAEVLASLYQAAALGRIAQALEDLLPHQESENPEGHSEPPQVEP